MADAATWRCTRCTFDNPTTTSSCAMCAHKRAVMSLSSKPRAPPAKKARTSISPNSTTTSMQAFRTASTSSSPDDDKVAKKMKQLREFGIDLPDDRMRELLARACYSVPVAASQYFERMASAVPATDTNSHYTTQDVRVSQAAMFFESEFMGAPYKLLGSSNVTASIVRSNVTVAIGDKLAFQAESIGSKRARFGGSIGTSAPSTSTPNATNGIVRVATMDHVQLGRLDREHEVMFHQLLKEGLVALGGVCVEAPLSTQVFATFTIRLFVYVHPRAFEIFSDGHALFSLSDALYSVLDVFDSRQRNPQSPPPVESTTDAVNGTPQDLETLFSAIIGPLPSGTMDQTHDPATEVTSLFRADFTLRAHQRQALSWMIWRERQAAESTSDGDLNPLWEKREFQDKTKFFINPFEKIASVSPPSPPRPCPGGILADDMGMGKTIMLLSLIAYRRYFDSAPVPHSTSGSPSALESRTKHPTLIVCPLSLLHQWKCEIEDRFRPQALSVFVYYGDERATMSMKSDIVLTTYGVLTSEFEKSASTSTLLTTEWERVILDEAHSIKNRQTTYFKASSALRATHRWCLTGTPLQNSLGDVFSLLSFLQFEPWSRVAWWQRVIARPFEQGDQSALMRLKVLLQPILLRRTKLSRDVDGKCIVELPPKNVQVVRLQFSEDERTFYTAVFDRSRAEFNGFVASGTTMSSYIAIFALLLRLRQACDHPFLALGRDSELANGQPSKNNGGAAPLVRLERKTGESMHQFFHRISSQLQQDAASAENSGPSTSSSYIDSILTQIREEGIEAQECPVCLDPPRDGVLTPCAHLLCEACLRDSVANDPESGCPVCRSPVDLCKVYSLSSALRPPSSPPKESVHEQSPSSSSIFVSTKLRQLIDDLQAIRREDSTTIESVSSVESEALPRQRRKVVVFSQWTHMLEMASEVLEQHDFKTTIFHGGMAQDTRERVLRKFHSDPTIDVLVISLKAGGVGLNLTCASVVVLLDPWWNPGVEDQAIDRVHRLGQTREVIVKRYIVDNTVEDMILTLQERKDQLARNVLVAAKSADERGSERLSLADLLQFFK